MALREEELSFELAEQAPQSVEAEQSVLGAILLEPSCLATVLEYLNENCFYLEQHRRLFSVIVAMFGSGKEVDYITVLHEAVAEQIFDSSQSAKVYLAQLMEMVPTTANIESYCQIVQERFYLRSLLRVADGIVRRIQEQAGDARSLLDIAEQQIFDIRQGRDANGLTRINEVIIQTYDQLQKLSTNPEGKYPGYESGFSVLDQLLGGLRKSDLIILAARPAMGKSAFALNIASQCAQKSGKQVAIFSLEMSKEQLVSRMLAAESLVNSHSLQTGTLSTEEWVRLASAAEILSKTNIYLDDHASATVAEMKAKLRRLPDLGLVVIDYLQLMSTGGRRNDNRVQEISEITRNLKIMAKELNVPVIALSQLGRGPDSRTEHRPMLSDLRDSGSIEQDADSVLFLYRDAYYAQDEAVDQTEAECIVSKNRHGATDTIRLQWDGPHQLFSVREMRYDEP